MEKIPRLCDLKGAALSILVFLSMHEERSWSVTELCGDESTGYSDKPVKAGLLRLMELGLIAEVRKNRYELKGGSVFQLPLSWDERIEAFGDSPKISGDSPRSSGVSPNRELEERVAALEAAVFRGLPVSEAGDSPIFSGDFPGKNSDQLSVNSDQKELYSGSFAEKFGVSPNDSGDSPIFEDEDSGQWSVDSDQESLYSGNIPEKFGESPNESGETPKPEKTVVSGQWSERKESGEIPEKVGDSPKVIGEIPNGLINNINNTKDKEINKYVGKDIYLLNGMSNERKVNSGQLAVVSDQGADSGYRPASGPVPEKAEVDWKAALAQLKGSMDRQTFNSLLGGDCAELIGYVDGHYTIKSKNSFVRDWSESRLREKLESILSVIANGKRSVSFVCEETMRTEAQPAVASEQDAPSMELLPESDDPEDEKLVEICNEYLLDPTGPEYSAEQLGELVGMHPDPDVLRFVLPRLSGFEAVKGWCAADSKTAKRWLLTYFKIVGKAVDRLSKNDRVSFGLIVSVCMDQGIEDLSGVETKTANQMRGKAIWLIESMAKEVMPK